MTRNKVKSVIRYLK